MLAEKINKAREAGFSDDEIATALSASDPSFAGKIGKAREAGFSVNEVLTTLSGGPKERDSAIDPSYLGKQFLAGAANTVTGKGQTLQALGADNVGASLEQAGRSITPDVQSASDRFRNPRMGDSTIAGYGVGSVPGMVAEGLGSFAGELPARAAGAAAGGLIGGTVGSVVPVVGTAAGAALGSTIGGFAGPAISTAMSTFGPELFARKQKNDGQLSASDYAVAAGSSALQGALNTVGMGSTLKGAAGNIGQRTLAETGKQAGKAAAVEGSTEAAQGAVSEVATNVGTKNSELSAGGVVDAAVTGLVGGAGTGGTVRVAGDATRKAGDVIGNRGYTYQDELANVAGELKNVADTEKAQLGNRYQSAEVVKKYETQLDTAQQTANKGVESRLKQLHNEGTITTDELNKGLASLKTPSEEGFDVIRRNVGDLAEGADAIQLAKRRVTLNELKKRSGLIDNPDKVTGGLTGIAEKMYRTAKNHLITAGLGVTAYSSIKGLGTIPATMTSVAGAAPFAAAIAGAALAPRAIDKLMGTYDPVQNLVQGKVRSDGSVVRDGEGLPSLSQVRAQARAQQQAQRDAQRQAMNDARTNYWNQRADYTQTMAGLAPEVVAAQNAQRIAAAAKSQAAADATPIVANARAGELNARAQAATARAEAANQVGAARATEVMQRAENNKALTAERLKGEQLKNAIREIDKTIKQLRLDKKQAASEEQKALITQQINEAKAEKAALKEGASPSAGTANPKPRISIRADAIVRPDGDGAAPEGPQAGPERKSVANTSLVQAVRNATKDIQNTKNRKAIREALKDLPSMAKREDADAALEAVYKRFPRYAEGIKARLDAEGFASQLDKQFRDSKTGKYEYDGPSDGKEKQYADPTYNKKAKSKQAILQAGINKALSYLDGFQKTEAKKLLDTMKDWSGKDKRRAIMEELIQSFPEHEAHFREALVPAINGSTKYGTQSSADNSKKRKQKSKE